MTSLARVHGLELMDRPDVAPLELAQGLRDLRRVNRWMGGTRAATTAILPLLRQIDAPRIRVLDVGSGSGDIPVALSRRARREALTVHILATDVHPETVSLARTFVGREPGVEVARADGLALEFDPQSFHIAMCHTALHHFARVDAMRLLAELARVASHAVVITDLRRSRAGLAGVWLLGATWWRLHPVTRHDSIVSMRGAFTPQEAARLAREAGLPSPRLRRHPFFRYSMVSQLQVGSP